MAATSTSKWMQQHDIYDPDLDALLQQYNIATEDDLQNLKESEWEEIYRKAFVERVKDIKEQKAIKALEKKMKKLEKLWRKASGCKISSIQSTSQTQSDGDAQQTQLDSMLASKANIANALKEAPELKKWMKDKGIWLKDLFEVLVARSVTSPDDLFLILEENMEEIKREVRVLRAQELKSQDAKMRMENILSKFEDEWRKSEGKKGKKRLYDDEKGDPPLPAPTMKQAAFDEMAEKGKELKDWMKAQQIWQIALFKELVASGVTSPDELADLKQKDFEEVVRKVRVDRFENLKSQTARASAEKLLVKFEKLYKDKQKK